MLRSLKESSCLSGALVEPSFVVGFDVGPSRLQLSAEVPDELALNSVVEDVEHTVGKSLNLIVWEEGRVGSALAILHRCAV
jgi:hypothetical protein